MTPLLRLGRLWLLVALLGLNVSPAAAQAPRRLPVHVFLAHAERQAETDAQRVQIRTALRDMLERTPASLRRARYAAFAGDPRAWTAPDVLQHFFVSDPPGVLDTRSFYRDVATPRARAAIRKQLRFVESALRGSAPAY